MAYCTNCGALLGAGAKSCRSCGAPADQRSAYDPPRRPTSDPLLNAPRRSWPLKPDRLDKTVGLVVVVVATAVLTLYFVFAWVIPFIEGFIEGFFGVSYSGLH